MRKAFGIFLVGFGIFALAMAILLPTVVVDKSKKTPLDLDITQVANGPAKLFDAATNKVEDVTLRALRKVRTDSSASSSTKTTLVESLCVAVDDGKLPKDCPTSADPRLLTVSTDRVTADRRTAEAVHVPKWNEAINGDTSARHTGLTYKFPIDTEKKTYQLFFADLGKAFPAKYQGTDKVRGIEVYKFVSETGDQPYTIKGTFPGTYNDVRTVFVEPNTGAILNGSERQIQTLAGKDGKPGQVALDATLSFSKDSVDGQVKFAQDKIDQLDQAKVLGPIVAAVLGIAALVGAFFLLRPRRDEDEDRTGAHRNGEPDPDEPMGEDDYDDESVSDDTVRGVRLAKD